MPFWCSASARLVASFALLSFPAFAQQNTPVSDAIRIAQAQNMTIGLLAGGPESTDTRIAADLAQVLDDGDRLRVLPILGQGSVQNIADLIYLKKIDVAIVNADVLTQTIQDSTIPKEDSVQYIMKLFPEEIHLLVRKDITSLSDLNGKPVSTGAVGSGMDVTAANLMASAHITPTIMHESQSVALERLRRGAFAAMFVVGGKPVPMLQDIEPGTGLHFLPIPLNAQLVDSYLPTSLDHQNYPNLIPPGPPIDTVAVSSVLLTLAAPPDSARAKRVNRFVDTLFERFSQLRQPGYHPKWQEVNLSAQIEGWTRYPEVQNLVRKEPPRDVKPHTSDAKPRASEPRLHASDAKRHMSFGSYLSQFGQTASAMNSQRRQVLFRDFLRWRNQDREP